MACVDVFNKFAAAEPINSKTPGSFLEGIKQCIKDLKKKQKASRGDGEGSLNSKKKILNYLKEENNVRLTTRCHSAFVDVFLRYFKRKDK